MKKITKMKRIIPVLTLVLVFLVSCEKENIEGTSIDGIQLSSEQMILKTNLEKTASVLEDVLTNNKMLDDMSSVANTLYFGERSIPFKELFNLSEDGVLKKIFR